MTLLISPNELLRTPCEMPFLTGAELEISERRVDATLILMRKYCGQGIL